MSLMLAPIPATPDTPTFTPPEGTPPIEGAPRFGPALSEAQNRLARSEPAREPARRPGDAERPVRADDRRPPSERVDDDAADPAQPAKDTVSDADAAESSETAEVVDEESTPTDEELVSTVATPMLADAVFADLAIADGAPGAGAPSMSDAMEELVEPNATGEAVPLVEELPDAPSHVSSDDAAPVVSEVLPSATAEAIAPVVSASRGASDAEAGSSTPAATKAVGGAVAAEVPLSDGGETTQQIAPTQDHAIGSIDTERGDDVAVADSALVESVEVSGTDATSETETVEVAAPKPMLSSAVTPEVPDRMVVRAGEAAAPGIAKAVATAQQPTEGPEGSLWQDVRSAFERIRSNGDTNEVRIRLRPAELGELIVQVRTQGDHVAVRLLASSAAAQQALLDDRLRLASELALAGFEEGSVDIDQQTAGDHRSQNGQRDGDGEDRPAPRSVDTLGGLDLVGSVRERFERRSPIHTEVGFRPGRHAYSTINLTL